MQDNKETFSLKSVKSKLFLNVIIMGVATTIFIIGVIFITTHLQLNRYIDGKLFTTANQFNDHLNSKMREAEMLATMVSEHVETMDYLFDGSKGVIVENYLPAFDALKEKFNIKEFNFFLPPAISYLKMGEYERYGEDFSQSKPSVVQANQQLITINSLEVDNITSDIYLNSVVPLFRDGRHLGAVEFGIRLDSKFINTFSLQTSSFLEVYSIDNDRLRKISTSFPRIFNLSKLNLNTKIKAEKIIYNMPTGDVNYGAIIKPIMDFNGNIVALAAIAQDFSEQKSTQYTLLIFSLLMLTIVLISVTSAIYIMQKRLFNPLQALNDHIDNTKKGRFSASSNLDKTFIEEFNHSAELQTLAKSFEKYKEEMISQNKNLNNVKKVTSKNKKQAS